MDHTTEATDPLGLVGSVVDGKYHVDAHVGGGGFSAVYRATHRIWKTPVALKMFTQLSGAPPEQRQQLEQAFVTEGVLLTELSSQTPNIVQARDVGTMTASDGSWLPFLVLEWLDGCTLEEALEQERQQQLQAWSIDAVYDLLEPVALALQVAHEQAVAHRDIKPGNLFVVGCDPRASDAVMKILDFGVAKTIEGQVNSANRTREGQVLSSFTPQYGAPEQFTRSVGSTGPWTDVYALALVAIEMLTGRPALDGVELTELAMCSTDPSIRPTPRTRGAMVSDSVEAVFRRALAVQPDARPQNAAQLWHELGEALGRSIASGPITGRRVQTPAHVRRMAQEAVEAGQASRRASEHETIIGDRQTNTPVSNTDASPELPKAPRRGMWLAGAGATAVLIAGGIVGYPLFAESLAKSPGAGSEAMNAAPAVSAAASAAQAEPRCPDGMVKIPAGQFFMGSDEVDAPANQKPTHNVKLAAFCIDIHEVTVDQYNACSEVGECRRAPRTVSWPSIDGEARATYDPLCNANHDDRGQHPINCVDWRMAEGYCSAQEKRLPSEAEWEYATRGSDGRIYPWGDAKPTAKHLNGCGVECVKWGREHGENNAQLYDEDDGFPHTAPVGSFPQGASRFGLHDVVGNVWEWVGDWYGPYAEEPLQQPTGPGTGERRVMRGGAYNGGYESWLRPSFRYSQDPLARSHVIGFRCAANFPAQ